MEFSGLRLEDLLPHREPMLLISEVLEVDSEQARTVSCVSETWPMGDESGVHALILIELAAQTAGVCNGWDRVHTKGLDSSKMGWLVGVKKADLDVDRLGYGTEIITSAKNTHVFGNLRETACEVRIANHSVANIVLQLFQA